MSAQVGLPEVTVAVINYNGMKTLPGVLQGILGLEYPAFRIMVLDNASTDGSREWLLSWVEEHAPDVCLYLEDENMGSAAARQRLLERARTRLVFFLDNDICAAPDVLMLLVETMLRVPAAAACHPEIQDETDPTVYHYNGGWINYLGNYISRPKPGSEERPAFEPFDVTSGGALLVDREAALHLGGFDEDFFFNMEDGDFTARLTLGGYVCLNVPSAVVHHNSKPRSGSKVFFQVRNRLFFITKLFSWRTLLLAAPALFVFELTQAAFLLFKGYGLEYIKGNLAFLAGLPQVLRKRRRFQTFKRLRDRDWLHSGEIYVPANLIRGSLGHLLVKSISHSFDLYWKVICRFC
jgi:GT2 family glycosyltransferase